MPEFLDPFSPTTSQTLRRLKGYRPIEITLTFRDGSRALPDSVGAPRIGSIYAVGPEILSRAEVSATIQRNADSRQDNRQSAIGTSKLPVQVYTTSERPILQATRGAAFRLYWHNSAYSVPHSGDVAIDPSKVFVDSQLGLIEIGTSSPQASLDQVVAYYYTQVTEHSARAPVSEWNVINTVSSSGYSTQTGLSQVYPVTRNKTDYITGKVTQLKPPNMDRTSPDYYPVYEYRLESDGSLVFSVPLHPFSDQPARIEIKYLTLGIEPRLFVDLARDADAGISPEVTPFKIAVETVRL